jgi:N-acetyl-anhydromuramyl-L-alanine amidase AmpD
MSEYIQKLLKKKYIRKIDGNNVLDAKRLELLFAHHSTPEHTCKLYRNHNQPPGQYKGNPDRKRWIKDQNKKWKPAEVIDEIVIHATGSASGNVKNLLKWMMYDVYTNRNNNNFWVTEKSYKKNYSSYKIHEGPTDKSGKMKVRIDHPDKKKWESYTQTRGKVGLFHYLIPREGDSIYEIINPDDYTCHSTSGSKNDRRTVGIELMSDSSSNEGVYTAKQYQLLFDLISRYLIYKYPTINKISSHTHRIVKYSIHLKKTYPKHCPGPKYNWKNLEDNLKSINCTYVKEKADSKRLKMAKKKKKDVFVPDMYNIDFWPNLRLTDETKILKSGKPIVSLTQGADGWNVNVTQILMKNQHLREYLYKHKGNYCYARDCTVFKPKL